MKTRSLEPEMLDNPSTPAEEICASLDFMAGINRWLGGTAAVTSFLERDGAPGDFTLLDVASGGGDIACGVAAWARRTGRRASITAIDLNPVCMDYAQSRNGAPEIRCLRHSAFDMASLGAFDYVVSSMFFHHLDDRQIAELLRLFAKSARRAYLVNDLYRSHPAVWGAAALGAFSGRRIVLNDAVLSVKRAFRAEDWERLVLEAGVRRTAVRRRPVFRLTLEGRP